MIRASTVIVAALLVSVSARAQAPITARARAAVLDALDDPRSALFRQVVAVNAITACGRVSARNAYNGMVSRYFVYFGNVRKVAFLDEGTYEERVSFRRICKSRVKLPSDDQDAETAKAEADIQRAAFITFRDSVLNARAVALHDATQNQVTFLADAECHRNRQAHIAARVAARASDSVSPGRSSDVVDAEDFRSYDYATCNTAAMKRIRDSLTTPAKKRR